jgi:pilus assembly protein Flp/PilA
MRILETQIQVARAYLTEAAPWLRRLSRDERGQTAVEYLGIVAFVVVLVVALTAADVIDPFKTAFGEFLEDKVGDLNGED